MRALANIYRLGIKEFWSLLRDPFMLVLIAYMFSVAIYTAATAKPDTLHLAPIAVVDEDGSALSARIISAFFPPQFGTPILVDASQVDHGLDAGQYTFSLGIPPNFQRDVLAGRQATIQLNVDATRMSQAFTGSGYVQQITSGEVQDFVRRYRGGSTLPVEVATHMRFNPNLEASWFGALVEIINSITMVSIVLTGAALIREREHGTVEHLLVMPVTPLQIMVAKIWSMGLVVLASAVFSLIFVVRGALHVPIQGSILLFVAGAALNLFATTSLAIFMATLARNMPQFGMMMLLVLLPMEILSGSITPRESMPQVVQDIMFFAPTTQFVEIGQAILYRGAGIDVLWKPFLALLVIGSALFALSLRRFRRTITQMA
jgi:ABC-2 type transport system permease protein